VPTYTIRADSTQWGTLNSFGQNSTTTQVLNGTADTKDVLAFAEVSATNDPGVDGNGVALRQFAFRFDCSSITAGETISSVTFTLRPDYVDADGRALSAVKYDWGSTVDTGDWRTPSQLAACSVYATRTFNTADQNTNVNLTLSGSTLATDVAARGTVRMLLVFTSNISGTFPAGALTFIDPSNGTVANRPTLTVVTTGGNVSLSRNVADSSTVSDALTRSTARSRAAADPVASLDSQEVGYAYITDQFGNGLTVPHVAGEQAGDVLDARMDAAMDVWNNNGTYFMGKGTSTASAATLSWALGTTTSNRAAIIISDGTSTIQWVPTVMNSFVSGQRYRIRLTYTRNTGAGQYGISLFYSQDFSADLASSTAWTSLASTTGSSIGAMNDVSTSATFGSFRLSSSQTPGRIYAATVKVGSTTTVAINCNAITSAAATTFTATTGQAVTINKSGTRQAVAVLPIGKTVALPRGATDALTSSDALARSGARSRAAADSVAVSDAVAGVYAPFRNDLTRAASDALTVTDAASRATARARAVADTLTASDTVGTRRDNAVPVSDALTLADTVSTLGTRARAVADSLAASESVARSVGRSRSAAESVTAADAAARVLAVVRQIVDSVTLTGVTEVLGTAGQMTPGTAPAASINASAAPGSTMTRSTAPTSTMTGA